MPSFEDIIAALKGGKPQPDAMPFGVGGPAEPMAEPTNIINPIIGHVAQKTLDVPKNLIDQAAQFDPNDIHGSTQRVIPAAADTVMALMGRGIAAPTKGLGAFGGINAKTANLRNLDMAMTQAAQGADPARTRLLTGWEQHPIDQKWRFEIPDNKLAMKFMPKNVGDTAVGSMDSLVKHPELMKAYPDLRGLRLDLTKDASQMGGGYLPASGSLSPRFETHAVTPAGARDVLSHELQHGIQDIEGFTAGAAPEMFAPEFEKMMRKNNLPYNYEKLDELANKTYHNTAGEVEARNVSKRMDLSPLQRLVTPPAMTQDVPYHEQYDTQKMIELLKSRFK